MNYFPLTSTQQDWKDRVAALAEREIGPRAAEYDRKAEAGYDRVYYRKILS